MEDLDQSVKSTENQQIEQVCIFFKKPIKKRTISDKDNEEDLNKDILHIQKRTKSKSYFSSGSSVKESAKPAFQFDSSRVIQVQHNSKATATNNTEFLKDARDIRERALKQEGLKGKSAKLEDAKLYKGMNSYKDYKADFRKEQQTIARTHGPLRPSAHIRVSTRFDYQPDICKDYKKTGYCGYGDSCKFMHDRGDYKSGWQLEKEWEEAEKARKMRYMRLA